MPDLSLENQLRAAGYHAVCGVDEAGRGRRANGTSCSISSVSAPWHGALPREA